MTKLWDLFDQRLYCQMVIDGFVTVRSNDGVHIANYSPSAQYGRVWNEVTLACRGLIFDDDFNVLARPWKKFFNLFEPGAALDLSYDGPIEVTDKKDGSLGILYNGGNGYAIATRGSLVSEQAIHATEVFGDRYSDVDPDPDYTFLFEIVYPANRIVLSYGDMDDLILLGAVHIETGNYVGPNEAKELLSWPGPATEVFEYKSIAEAFEAPPRPNAEGYVVRAGNNLAKIKQEDYVELHRVVTNLNARTIWERLGEGDTVESICEQIPDELHDFVKNVGAKLSDDFQRIADEVIDEFYSVASIQDRKTLALNTVNSNYRGLLFKLYDRRPIDKDIWKMIRP